MDIPVHSLKDSETRICYDGQMGNWETLAQQFGVKNEPFIEERILLTLFKKYERVYWNILKILFSLLLFLMVKNLKPPATL
jgi:hypothetical protein